MAPGLKLDQLNYLEELQTMLAENVIMWTQKWKQEGLQEGLQKAATAMSEHGFSVSKIAVALELDEAEVRRMLG